MGYDCYIVEQRTDSGDVYLAINLQKKKVAALSRRKTFIGQGDTKAINALVEKLKYLGIAGYGRLSADRDFGDKISIEKCKDILSAVFAGLLPQHGFSLRESQVELAEEILYALNRRQVLLAEGETGTGKTLAYLIAAILIKRGRTNDFWNMGYYPKMQYIHMAHMPIVVSTSSIALRKALVNDYIPWLSRVLLANGVIDRPITTALRKGRGHYVCERKLRAHIGHEPDTANKAILADILKIVQKGANVDLLEMDGLSPYTKRKICVPGSCTCITPIIQAVPIWISEKLRSQIK